MDIYTSKQYKISRMAYMVHSTFMYCILLLIADVFLSKVLNYIGMSDSLVGIVGSLVSLAMLVRFFSIFIVEKIRSVKSFSVILFAISQLLFAMLYILPFASFGKEVKIVLAIVCILGAYAANHIVSGMLYNLAYSYVDPGKRGVFSAKNEMLTLITGIVYVYVMGRVMDYYESVGNIKGGFLFLGCTILLLAALDFIFLMLIKNDKDSKKSNTEQASFNDVLKNTFGNSRFLSMFAVNMLYHIAIYTTTGFLGTFKSIELALSVTAVQLINNASNVLRMIVSVPFGKFSDKHSYASGMKLGFIILLLGFCVLMFTTPKTWWLIIIFTILFNVSYAGTNANLSNILYDCIDNRYFVQGISLMTCICGTTGFLMSILAGKILGVVQAKGNMVFGHYIYGQQILAAISMVAMIVCVAVVHFVLEKQTSKTKQFGLVEE